MCDADVVLQIFDSAGDVTAAQESPGRSRRPIVIDIDEDEDDEDAAPVPAPPAAQTPISAAAASRAALLAEFLTPGNNAPNYFQLKVAGTEFCVSVGLATSLEDVIRTIQRGLLDPMGWPRLVGVRGEEEAACWDELVWEAVKCSGACARALYIVVEMEF